MAIYVAFKINQEFITNTWCINISKPEAKCYGKCYLSKKMKSSKEEKNNSGTLPQLEEVQKNYYYSGHIFDLSEKERNAFINNFYYLIPTTKLFTASFLEPPEDRLS